MALWVVKSTHSLLPPSSTCLVCRNPSPKVSSSSLNRFARGFQDKANRERDRPACPCVADSPTSNFPSPRKTSTRPSGKHGNTSLVSFPSPVSHERCPRRYTLDRVVP